MVGKMKKLIYIVFSVFILFIIMGLKRENQKDNFTIEISSDKSTYIEGENIYLTFKVTNISGKVDSLYDWSHYVEENLDIKNENGEPPKRNLQIFYDGIFEKILSQKSTEYIENISFNIGYNGKTHSFHYFPRGIYTISGKLKLNNREIIKSNLISINVISPPDSEKLAFDEMMKLDSLNYFRSRDKDINIRHQMGSYYMDSLETYLYKFPKSVYTEKVIFELDGLKGMYNGYGYERNFPNVIFYIKNHPESKINKTLLYSIVEYYEGKFNDRVKGINFLQSLKTEINNPVLNKVIDEFK